MCLVNFVIVSASASIDVLLVLMHIKFRLFSDGTESIVCSFVMEIFHVEFNCN